MPDKKKVSTAIIGSAMMLISYGGPQFIAGEYIPGAAAIVLGAFLIFLGEYYKENY